ncbi:outer membrane beta-barrel protein [Zhongshania sp. BJYM1]|jgi:hypothetical protein|uniref:outer membrane beta-barrel protein n=1 Tax=Zhongshania aquatica TaxID=2965069 RepID=UPI0022B2FDE1|nr:hypothetical protein [Marortus sp. BJYM1]
MSRSIIQSFFFTSVSLFFASVVHAQETLAEESFSVHPVLTAGYTSGGDTLVQVEFDDGDREKLKAGGAFLFGFGAEFVSSDKQLAVRLTANYHFDSIDAENGETSFERYPIELMFFDQGERNRFGAGFTVHLSPTAQLKVDGQRRESINFDTALGLVFEYNYLIGNAMWLGVRYTFIDYETQNNINSVSVDGNHVGLMAHFIF